jgi:hypothetical protein
LRAVAEDFFFAGVAAGAGVAPGVTAAGGPPTVIVKNSMSLPACAPES